VSRPIGACRPDRSQIRAACRGSFPPLEKRIPITAGDPNFVPAGDLFPGARIQSLAVIAPGVVNYPVVNYLLKVLLKVGGHTTPPSREISLTSLNIAARRGARASGAQHDR
jgi:hypothetical protein